MSDDTKRDEPATEAKDTAATKDIADAEPPPIPPKSARDRNDDPPPAPPDTPGQFELTPQLDALRRKIHKTLAIYQKRHLNSRDHSPWEAMHGFIAFNVHTKLRRERPDGEAVNAIGWMLWGGRCRSQMMLTLAMAGRMPRRASGCRDTLASSWRSSPSRASARERRCGLTARNSPSRT